MNRRAFFQTAAAAVATALLPIPAAPKITQVEWVYGGLIFNIHPDTIRRVFCIVEDIDGTKIEQIAEYEA